MQLRKKPQEKILNHIQIVQQGMKGSGTQTCKSIDTSLQQLKMEPVTRTKTINCGVATDTVLYLFDFRSRSQTVTVNAKWRPTF